MHPIHLTDQVAIWERCHIEVKGNTLEPSLPITPYNLFDFYFPAGQAPQREQRSLHYEFLRVDASKLEAIVDFCERFGVLRCLADGKSPDILDAFAEESDPKELAQYAPWSVARARLARYGDVPAAPGGYCAMTIEEFREAQTSLRGAVAWAQMCQAAPSRDEASKARFNLRELFGHHLRLVYQRPIWDEQQTRWVRGWDIRSLEAAMYHMLFLDLQGPGLIRTCPWDQTIFLGDERTRYCSLRCQNAQNVTQFRERTHKPSVKRSSRSLKVESQNRKTKRKAKR